jgi:hypothetical protein|tara:strand:- start:6202 stop:6690 length:489 start_codon:yes stop_codon:yes gene_type:complete
MRHSDEVTVDAHMDVRHYSVIMPTDNIVMAMVDVFNSTLINYDDDSQIWDALVNYVFVKYFKEPCGINMSDINEVATQLMSHFIGDIFYIEQFKFGLIEFEQEFFTCISPLKRELASKDLEVLRMYPINDIENYQTITIIVDAIKRDMMIAPSLTVQDDLFG